MCRPDLSSLVFRAQTDSTVDPLRIFTRQFMPSDPDPYAAGYSTGPPKPHVCLEDSRTGTVGTRTNASVGPRQVGQIGCARRELDWCLRGLYEFLRHKGGFRVIVVFMILNCFRIFHFMQHGSFSGCSAPISTNAIIFSFKTCRRSQTKAPQYHKGMITAAVVDGPLLISATLLTFVPT
ncbi:hypothetical protein K435DRAFT_860959 [Dendrothele bispora CBS 962.96]|uniref:Uncharacterized protein n=1 Tax=Dendrothele bispora (strain CBS 962.96) TaxID=1314807 RepID=A0A4S8LWI5_DENBC|nr:hypothetical protein K435DRAFT_860959 [Dendrothele bispora CBS 962.96]